MPHSPRIARFALVILFAATGIDSPAKEAAPGIVQVPAYCDVSGHLTMENCSLVNMALAEEYFDAARLTRSQANTQSSRKIFIMMGKKCDKARARSRAESGGGSLDDVIERECRADEFHAAASRILAQDGRRKTIPSESTQAPTYCTHDRGNPFGCVYINRLIAIDFFRRAGMAQRKSSSAASESPVTLETIESACSASFPPTSAGGSADTQEVEKLKCVQSSLHKAALELLR